MAAVACAMHARERGDGSCDWGVRCAVRGVNTHDYRWGEAWCREQARQRSKRTVYLARMEARCTVTGVYSTHSTHADKYLVSRSVWLTMPAVSVCVLLLT
jgi:hypothetical protein